MVSKEKKFLKMLDLYTQVVESGSTWGIQSDADLALDKEALKHRRIYIDPNEKYVVRQTACMKDRPKQTNYLNRVRGIKDSICDSLDVQDTYPNVRTGTPIREPNKRRVYW